ncbi:prolipoprotein diacylglyceryl transferase [Paenibacillus selenitireducens]|uniref:Phosphatidylglycerol--prolipoprotein diacylglyceryl transferase n=1 Tax=Paenibacillus selenitireducens TaxID=1324314 RepID=A0A1T2X8X1_9BACL|nr:prolipoprotein diacylglyceryl transferase [Paenibacillus selenitireducens]OPA76338.1 prolipoprotein diacylglyceryl transferase [Paenibacillus selenitireducens]
MQYLLLNPIAFSIGPIAVHWYGIILGTAALVGLLLAIREGKRFGIPQDFFMDLLLLGVPSSIIAARIYYVAFMWDEYKNNLWDVFKIWNGGIAIYGALIGAVICAIIFVRKKGYSFWRIADICAPGLLIGQMIGRWGNFVNQEAYGGPAEESFLRNTLHLPNFIVNQMNVQGVFHHPAFLYESVWSFIGILILFVLRRQKFLRAGELFMSYFIWYSIGRFFIEGLRTDSLAFIGSEWLVSIMNFLWAPMELVFEPGYLDPAYGNVRISQLLAILIIIAAVIIIVVRRVKGYSNVAYSAPIVSTKGNAVQEVAAGQAATAESTTEYPQKSDSTDDQADKKGSLS